MTLFLKMDPPKGRLMWLNTQVNFFFAKNLVNFLQLCITQNSKLTTYVYNTIKKEFSNLFREMMKHNIITSQVALSNPKNVFTTLIEAASQLGYGWFEILNYNILKKEITIHVVDSIWAQAFGIIGQPACEFIAPVIAAVTEVAHGKQCEVHQETCISAYDPTCSFKITLSNNSVEVESIPVKQLPGGLPIQDISLLSRNITHIENGWFHFFGHPLVLLPSTLFPKLQHVIISQDNDSKQRLNELSDIFYQGASQIMKDIAKSPKIAHGLREAGQGVQKTVASLLDELSKLGWGTTQQQLMVFNEINREYHIILTHSVIAENYPVYIDEPVCHVLASTFAALVGVFHNQKYSNKELKCIIRDDAACEFYLKPE